MMVQAEAPRWVGTEEDIRLLVAVVNKNCVCKGRRTACSLHEMMLDQKILNHLAFVAARRWAFIQAELDPLAEWF